MRNFFLSDSGAVTVDWVVLTAGLVGASSVVGVAMEPVIEASLGAIEDELPGGGSPYGDVINIQFLTGYSDFGISRSIYSVETESGTVLTYDHRNDYGVITETWTDPDGNEIPEDDWPDLPAGFSV